MLITCPRPAGPPPPAAGRRAQRLDRGRIDSRPLMLIGCSRRAVRPRALLERDRRVSATLVSRDANELDHRCHHHPPQETPLVMVDPTAWICLTPRNPSFASAQ